MVHTVLSVRQEKILFYLMAQQAQGGWPSYRDIVEDCGLSSTSAQWNVRALARAGYLTLGPRYAGRAIVSNVIEYRDCGVPKRGVWEKTK